MNGINYMGLGFIQREICRCDVRPFLRCFRSFYTQDIKKILGYLKGSQAQRANLFYIQDEVFKFKLGDDGREWSVYGSPVRPRRLPA